MDQKSDQRTPAQREQRAVQYIQTAENVLTAQPTSASREIERIHICPNDERRCGILDEHGLAAVIGCRASCIEKVSKTFVEPQPGEHSIVTALREVYEGKCPLMVRIWIAYMNKKNHYEEWKVNDMRKPEHLKSLIDLLTESLPNGYRFHA